MSIFTFIAGCDTVLYNTKTNDFNQRLLLLVCACFYLFRILRYSNTKCKVVVFIMNNINSISSQSDELNVIVKNADSTSLSGFKKTTKCYLLSKYSYGCFILNCYICQI